MRGSPAMKRILYAALLLLPALAEGQGYLEQFPFRQPTKYFDFRYKRNPEKIATIARFADGFINLLNKDFFNANFDYPILVLVLEDRASFQEFLRREFHDEHPPQFGIYMGAQKLFATYEESGLGTFAHEILHPLVERNLRERPLWAIEGIPTFFEKFYGYWKGEELIAHWGYQNPWRIRELGSELTQLDLKNILATENSQGQFHESDLRLVSVFLWHQGKFQRFLRLIQQGEMNGYHSYFEAALEMPIERAAPLWQDYLNQIEANRNDVMRLPASTVLNTESDFERFLKYYGVPPTHGRETTALANAKPTIAAQAAPATQKPLQTIRLKNGQTIIGRIKMRMGSQVYITTQDGKEVQVQASEVASDR
jgi:hypothetical protein